MIQTSRPTSADGARWTPTGGTTTGCQRVRARSLPTMGEIADWRERHQGHQITHTDASPGEDIRPHTGAMPKKRPGPRGTRTPPRPGCHAGVALSYTDFNPREPPPRST